MVIFIVSTKTLNYAEWNFGGAFDDFNAAIRWGHKFLADDEKDNIGDGLFKVESMFVNKPETRRLWVMRDKRGICAA